jgi:transposase
MFLRCKKRHKDGKEHLYWSIVENRRVCGGRVIQRNVLYLGELNGRQEESWQKSIDLFAMDGDAAPQQVSLFPEEHLPLDRGQREVPAIGIRLSGMRLLKPRQWGACWLGCQLWNQLGLDDFWQERLPVGRQGARWVEILKLLTIYRLVSPGSEWHLHRHWFDLSAMADLIGGDFGLAEIHRLYECHDKVLKHKTALFDHLTERWKTLFGAKFEVLLYDLTSTYFESDPPFPEGDKRKFGYSRDKRSDCVQVVIALILTPDGFPIAYEVLAGNTTDKTTLGGFLEKIEKQYGKAERIWIMDRGIPTEEVLEQMRKSNPPVSYLVGTPKGRLTALEKDLLDCPWKEVRPNVQVKLISKEGETYVLAQSEDRIAKERSMRRRRLRKYLKALKDLSTRKTPIGRDAFHQALGAAKKEAGRDARHVHVEVFVHGKGDKQTVTFTYTLDRKKLRVARRREGRYLLRTNLNGGNPVKLWEYYLQLTEIEQAFKELKGDLAIRPIHHQLEHRIESHIFISFLAFCLLTTLKFRLKSRAGGLTPRSALEKFAAVQMLDVHLPTTDGREIVLTRYTQPEKELMLLLDQLKMTLPEQPPPKIYSTQTL